MPVIRQCKLAGVSRATVYGQRKPAPTSEQDLELLRLIDEQYTRRPFYGSRKMVTYLKVQDHRVNRKRVQRLMRILGLAGMAPGPNQVWSTDITYIRLAHGFVYQVAIIDWYSRSIELENQQHAGHGVLCRLFGRGITAAWTGAGGHWTTSS